MSDTAGGHIETIAGDGGGGRTGDGDDTESGGSGGGSSRKVVGDGFADHREFGVRGSGTKADIATI